MFVATGLIDDILFAPVCIAVDRPGEIVDSVLPIGLDCKKLLTPCAALFTVPSIDPPPLKDDGCTTVGATAVAVVVGAVVFAVVLGVGCREALIAAATLPPVALAAAIAELTAIIM
jgi:hypothetical protein